MFLRATIRKKDGKEHRYFSVVENRRVGRGRVVQRHVLYLGEINDSQNPRHAARGGTLPSAPSLNSGRRSPTLIGLWID
jgi:hypothetical protein